MNAWMKYFTKSKGMKIFMIFIQKFNKKEINYMLIYLIKYIILNNLGIDNPFLLKYLMKLQRKIITSKTETPSIKLIYFGLIKIY